MWVRLTSNTWTCTYQAHAGASEVTRHTTPVDWKYLNPDPLGSSPEAAHAVARGCAQRNTPASCMQSHPCMAVCGNGPDAASIQKPHERTRMNRPSCIDPCGSRGMQYRSSGTCVGPGGAPSPQDERRGTRSNHATDHGHIA